MSDKQNYLTNHKLYVIAFIAMMAILFSMWLIGFTSDFKGEQANVFFQKTYNYNADFYNVAEYSTSPNPYIGESPEKAYLPLSYILMRLFSNMADYKNLGPFEAGLSSISLTTSTFFIFLVCAIIFLQLYEQKTGTKATKFFTALSIILSGAFLRAFERGNIILLAIVCVIFFIMNYKSEKKVLKELSFISLAIAVALKGYPAILGILLLYEKRWMEAARLVVYGLLFIFVPFLFIEGGFSNIPLLLNNMKLNSEQYSHMIEGWRFGLRYLLVLIYPELNNNVYDIAKIITYVFFVLSLIVAPFLKTKWKKYAVLLSPIILMPENSGGYCILYILPFFVMFLNEEKHNKSDIIYLFLFILIFNPYQIPFLSAYSPNACVSVIWLWLLGEGVLNVIKHRIKKPKSLEIDSVEKSM